MGLYDREYGRDDYGQQPGLRLDGPRMLSTNLVLITVGIYLLQILTKAGPNGSSWVTNLGMLHPDTLQKPWLIFQFLTYGFLHSPTSFQHIAFNMIGVWMFGRVIEQRYGRSEFLSFYLVAIVFAGATWYLGQLFSEDSRPMLGASGGLSALLILFVFNFPKQTVLLMGFIPMPAWAFGIFFLGQDIMGALSRTGNVAYTAHLGGALFGFLYYRFGWRVSEWLPSNLSFSKPKRRTKLRIHEPDDNSSESNMDQRVNEILKKIQEQGQDSLTWRERRFMEKASQEYQKRR